ncbi:hypothetical protein RHMOL_Rhmol08G0096800 [Rhododendron molle]|uniref:Uncharacterized protein n=1 Tax=Rhododendron molle TaxID=49168 RepID=A0ACC0MLL4_RHOML|nr:hypothetical protein RHMOL_Rhmol08G0096800 [Rhododendron molle]
MSEEEQIGVADDVTSVEQSSLQASDGEALISPLLKTRTMLTGEEQIGVAVEIEPVEQSWLHLLDLMKEFEFEDFMNLGSSYEKKAHEIDEGDNGLVDEVEVVVPQCGMIFDTVDEAYNFYNGYARKIGFSVRKLRTNKKAGGPQYLNFIPSDCYNLIQKKRAGFLKKGDSQCLLEYFKQKTQENKHFFYSFRTTNENEVRGVFFCDAKSRRDYGLFGDAICFDTTFRTNNYDMLCAPIVGINNHGQTTLFGCGLLDGETTDAVTWLFTTFLEAMGGKKPLFRHLQYESLPPRYHLKRWTRKIVDEDVFDLHGDLIPNDIDPSLTIRYSGLSQISQRIISRGSKFPDVSSLTEVGLLELEAKVESWISSRGENHNVASNAQNSSTLNVDDEAPLRDPTKRQRRGQGSKGEGSTAKAMTRFNPLNEVEEDENAHDTTSTQGPPVEQPNMAANVGMNALQVPNVAWCL